jgi:DNA-binding NarL/FixJ family response regulator
MLPKKRIILANDSQFFRDAFRRVLEKRSDLEIICEVKDFSVLSSVIQKNNPDWVIISMPNDGEISKAIEKLLIEYPTLLLMAVALDGSRIRVEWMEHKEKEVDNLSLDDFIKIFENDPHEESDPVIIAI